MINMNNNDGGKTLFIGERQISFGDGIETVLEFSDLWIVLLGNIDYVNGQRSIDMSKQPLNNIYAVDKECNVLWNIKQIIPSGLLMTPDEQYTGAVKISDNILRVTTFNCFAFDIDINTLEVVDKIFTK